MARSEWMVAAELITLYLRPWTGVLAAEDATITATFDPPLSTAEQATLADIQLLAKLGLTNDLTLAEFQAIKPDLATAKTFVGIASPTAAQSNAALKATIRVLGALLRA